MKNRVIVRTFSLCIMLLFIGVSISSAISIDSKTSIVNNQIDEDCDCLEVDSSGKSICDLLLQKMDAIDLKLYQIGELYDKYKDYPILGQIYGIFALILLYKVSFYETFFELLNCDVYYL